MPVDDDRQFWLELVRITDRGRTIRTITVGACIVIGVAIVVYGVIQVVSQPPWLTLALTILAALVGPSCIIKIVVQTRSSYIKKNHARIKEYETRLDKERESSNLVDPGKHTFDVSRYGPNGE